MFSLFFSIHLRFIWSVMNNLNSSTFLCIFPAPALDLVKFVLYSSLWFFTLRKLCFCSVALSRPIKHSYRFQIDFDHHRLKSHQFFQLTASVFYVTVIVKIKYVSLFLCFFSLFPYHFFQSLFCSTILSSLCLHLYRFISCLTTPRRREFALTCWVLPTSITIWLSSNYFLTVWRMVFIKKDIFSI